MVIQKLKEWGLRYLPGEIIGTLTALIGASICHYFYPNRIVVAFAGSIGESIGFFGTVLVQELLRTYKVNKATNSPYLFAQFRKIILNIMLEFGLAGVLDDLILRPFFMVLFPILLDNFMLGIVVGKLVGDITFYMLVIVSYEFKQWLNKRIWNKN